MIRAINSVASVLATISDALARLGVLFVAVILFVQVVLRYVFNTGLPWPEEASRYVMIWVTMLAGSLLVRDEQLIAVDFFDKYWPKSWLRYRDALFRLLLAIMLALLFWYGLDQAMFSAFRVTSTLEISWFWPYLANSSRSSFDAPQYDPARHSGSDRLRRSAPFRGSRY